MSSFKWGDYGEELAREFLLQKKYNILKTKFRSRFGEIDIIARDRDTLVFVEVKTRFSQSYGLPEEAVNARKLKKIKKSADYYILLNPNSPKKLRIDVVAIEIEEGKVARIEIINVD